MQQHTGPTDSYESWFYLKILCLGLENLVDSDIGKLAHLDLASAAFDDFHVVEPNVLLAMETDSLHHPEGCFTSTNRRLVNGGKLNKRDRFQE